MVWPSFRGGKGRSDADSQGLKLQVAVEPGGLRVFSPSGSSGWIDSPGSNGPDSELALYLRQLVDEGFAAQGVDEARISWDGYYSLSKNPEHASSIGLLRLPPAVAWRPRLVSKGTITDSDFSISIESWRDANGNAPSGNVKLTGALFEAQGKATILPEAAWRLVEGIRDMRARKARGGTIDDNRRDWSRLREMAVSAQADLADFLKKTIVLTPERLRIDMRKAEVGGEMLVEVLPTFDGAPDRWMEFFDRFSHVPDRYEIPDGTGLVQVLLPIESRAVLSEIRKMPGRRVVGDRAQSFVRNPFATLGEAASVAIDPDQFDKARAAAGISFARFVAHIERDAAGNPIKAGILIEEATADGVMSEEVAFESAHLLENFVGKMDSRVAAGSQCCHWQGWDLEILGDTPEQLNQLRDALLHFNAPRRIAATDIFDLSLYSERILGFGVERPYYSPFIAKKSDEQGWFPENIELGICFPTESGETIALPLDERNLANFRERAHLAKSQAQESFNFPGCPKPVPVDWALGALEALGVVREAVSRGGFDPAKLPKPRGVERKGLVVKANVDSLDYEEKRGSLGQGIAPPVLPASLGSGLELKSHQLEGLAWLQHMWRNSPKVCSGAMLADDMGLGKTLQLLAFMAWAIETSPGLDPFLVVAPVTLLDNWKAEIEKFFQPGAMKVLTLYGASLSAKRVKKSEIDEELRQAGAPKLLAPGWVGGAQVVLTTYETLRDLEFSLAAQRWSAMICDEAQKIKNPNAMVTRAAKKQNARLKIACTGTPVENTLTDLWCLFDYIQPGMLGALREFGSRYRRPIEAKTQEEKDRVDELRARIDPQKLRRTKAQVAKDLPRKIEDPHCRNLNISAKQRALYADAVARYRNRSGESTSGLQSPLGLLQYLRRICSDPRPPGLLSTGDEPIALMLDSSPKMAWMLGQLRSIQSAGDKAIIFCEFRDLQRSLQRAITESLAITPDVINGDTTTDSESSNSRQKRIDQFQRKPGFNCIILSPLAVGFGVNIQAANHVIHFTRTWNPAKEDQATDRAYRIGQTKDVYVYYPVVVASDFLTFDAKLHMLLDRKRALSEDMLNGSGDVSPADFGDIQAPDGGNAFGEEPVEEGDIEALDPEAFEAFCALLWSKAGYSKTIKTPRSGDGGVDIVAIDGARGALIQCKTSSVDGRDLGWEAIKDVAAGSVAYGSRNPGIRFELIAATNRMFNSHARHQAQALSVRLVERDELADMLRKTPIKRGELDRFRMKLGSSSVSA